MCSIFFVFKKHEIPLSAIPCLSYRRALDKENQIRLEMETNATENGTSNDISAQPMITTNAVIETVKENLQKQSLNATQITEYCQKLFHFKNIRVMRFK